MAGTEEGGKQGGEGGDVAEEGLEDGETAADDGEVDFDYPGRGEVSWLVGGISGTGRLTSRF